MLITASDLNKINGFIFDLDGVIYKGDTPIEGAKETISLLRQKNKKFIFVTNHTKYLRDELHSKLHNLGIEADEKQILTASIAIIEYLKQDFHSTQTAKINLIGYGGIIENLTHARFELTENKPDYVIIAWDPQFDYEKMYIAAKNVREGAKFIVSSPDRYVPSERGLELGFGTLGASIAYATNKKPVYIGKPYPPMIQTAMKIMNTIPEKTIIVGDTLETDIQTQHMVGLGGSVLVLTGNTSQANLNSISKNQKPSLVFESIKDFLKHIK